MSLPLVLLALFSIKKQSRHSLVCYKTISLSPDCIFLIIKALFDSWRTIIRKFSGSFGILEWPVERVNKLYGSM